MKNLRKTLTVAWLAVTGVNVMANPDTRDAQVLTDFSGQDNNLTWFVVNDNVMGGRSDGGFTVENQQLIFSGRTNTRGGGFSSIRTRGPELDLAAFDGIRLQVKGDGRRYTWQIRTNARFRGQEVSYWADFDTEKDRWISIDLPFTRFVPKFRGMELNSGPPQPANIRGMGLMIYDGQDGEFELRLQQVAAFRAPERATE